MEITGTAQNAQASNELINAARAAELSPVKKSNVTAEQVKVPAVDQTDLKRFDEKRLADIKRVVERNSFKNTFAVRDNTFTIFKDQDGQYITRFTDLRDGTITYVKEQEVQAFGGGDAAHIQAEA